MMFWFVTRRILGAVAVEKHAVRNHNAHRATHINIHGGTGEQKSACEVTVLSSSLLAPISCFFTQLAMKIEGHPNIVLL
jgi:hypothetical protein